MFPLQEAQALEGYQFFPSDQWHPVIYVHSFELLLEQTGKLIALRLTPQFQMFLLPVKDDSKKIW